MLFSRFVPTPWKEWLKRRAGAVSLRGRLANLRRAGFAPRQIIDAGAYKGEWTLVAHDQFPSAAILMIEPQPQLDAHLRSIAGRLPGIRFRPALLGPERRRVRFLLEETNSRVVPAAASFPPSARVCDLEMDTLAEIAQAEGFGACDLLKLDLQGHELHALQGAGGLFGRIEVIVCEVSFLRIGEVPRAREVLDAFHAKGYRLYDLFGFNYRPLDGALWQADLMFVRGDSALLGRESDWS